MELNEKVIQKFNEFFKETDECIEFPKLNNTGYGDFQVKVNGKNKHYLMHRVAFQLTSGLDINPDNIVCHRCDNPRCMNPRHLFIGTHKDNHDDKVAKGRDARGKKNGQYKHGRYTKEVKAARKLLPRVYHCAGRKLTVDQVKAIKRMISSGYKLVAIASELNVSPYTVRDISCNRVYQSIAA